MIFFNKKITTAVLRSSVDIGWFSLHHPKHANCRLTPVIFLPVYFELLLFPDFRFQNDSLLSVLIEYFYLKRHLIRLHIILCIQLLF